MLKVNVFLGIAIGFTLFMLCSEENEKMAWSKTVALVALLVFTFAVNYLL